MASIFFLIFFTVLLSSFRRGADLLSPSRVFILVWSFVLGLTELKLSYLQHEWSFQSWIMLLIGPASFLLGIFIVTVFNLDTTMIPVEEMRVRIRLARVSESRFFAVLGFSVALYLLSYITIYLVKGSIPLLSGDPAAARKEFSIFGIGVFLNSFTFTLYFVLIYHILIKGKPGRKWVLKTLVFVSGGTYILLLQRFQIVMAGVMCFSLLYYMTDKIRLKTVVGFAAGLIVLFYWISSVRTGELIQYYLYTMSRMKYSYHYAFLTEPYMYLVMNLENFARSVDKLESFTFGYYSFDFILALTGLKHWLAGYFTIDDTPFLISGYNTYSAFWTYYRDFGVLGVFIIPLILGIGVGRIYYSLRREPNYEHVTAYSVCMFVMVISFFNSPIGFLWFIYNIAMMVLILKAIRLPKRHLSGRIPDYAT